MTFSRPRSEGAIDIAPGILIDGTVEPRPPVTIQRIPAGRAAHLRLAASYAHLPAAWGKLRVWVTAQDLQPAGLDWEVYTDTTMPISDLYMLLA